MALGSFSFCQTATPPASVSSPGQASCTSKHIAIKMSKSAMMDKKDKLKMVWVWTENKEVFCASVERGWNTFLFLPKNRQLANDWSSIATIQPLFLEGSHVIDEQQKEVAIFYNVSSPQDLQTLKPEEIEADSLIISFQGEWQVIPAENIVAAFQGFRGAVLAVSTSSTDAQVFLEALEQGLDGVVLKVDKLDEIIRLKGYVERRNADCTGLELTRATISKVEVVGMGDRVCVDLCSIMRPGEGLLVGSFARGLFLVHSECLETNYIASRPFRVNAGPVHAYVAVPGGKTSYLSELCAGKEVLIVDQNGSQRTATVGRVKIESRPLILVEAKEGDETYNIFLQNAETVGLICPSRDDDAKTVIPVTSLKVGDKVLLRKQGGARHTGIEITEFILEK
ncbi:3-dehydroquinate synthase [Rhynchospora pubera]|uniref:3-dehydroquinate synthase n=1 Tax=Rhynchospora pubera TaxID=906938 RepID=A0AAV8G027_9POAL|nr:3-dehydroquinate synthase [Rhynchospora pubera]